MPTVFFFAFLLAKKNYRNPNFLFLSKNWWVKSDYFLKIFGDFFVDKDTVFFHKTNGYRGWKLHVIQFKLAQPTYSVSKSYYRKLGSGEEFQRKGLNLFCKLSFLCSCQETKIRHDNVRRLNNFEEHLSFAWGISWLLWYGCHGLFQNFFLSGVSVKLFTLVVFLLSKNKPFELYIFLIFKLIHLLFFFVSKFCPFLTL